MITAGLAGTCLMAGQPGESHLTSNMQQTGGESGLGLDKGEDGELILQTPGALIRSQDPVDVDNYSRSHHSAANFADWKTHQKMLLFSTV